MDSDKILPIYAKIFQLIILHLDKTSDGRFHASSLNSFGELGYSAGVVRPAIKYWVKKGFLEYTHEPSSMGMFGGGTKEFWELTTSGLDFSIAERIRTGANRTLSDDSLNIPAADRFVSISDNQPIVDETKEALTTLADAIRGSNDLFATAEDRIQISEEISYIRDLINKPRVHVAALWDATKNNQTLVWLSQQTAVVFVRDLASKVLESLHHIIQFLQQIK